MNEVTVEEFWSMYLMVHLFFFVATCVVGYSRLNSAGAIVLAIFFPVLGFIVVLFLKKEDKDAPPAGKYRGRRGKVKALPFSSGEDPVERWERQQRIAQGAPPPPSNG